MWEPRETGNDTSGHSDYNSATSDESDSESAVSKIWSTFISSEKTKRNKSKSNGRHASADKALPQEARSSATSSNGNDASVPSLPTPKMVGELLIKTMNSLSIQEREQVDDDIHGISTSTPAAAAVIARPLTPSSPAPADAVLSSSATANTTNADTIPMDAAYSNGTTSFSSVGGPIGAGSSHVETPYVIKHCLESFDQEVEATLKKYRHQGGGNSTTTTSDPSSPTHALELAFQQNRDYVQSLRLRYIRAELYNIKKAVHKFVKTFATKLDLFGESLLTKDILLSDLSMEDMLYLQTGSLSILPRRDRAGRPFLPLVVGLDHKLDKNLVTSKHKCRVLWYLANTIVQDEETQIKGVIGLVYNNLGSTADGSSGGGASMSYVEESEVHFKFAQLLSCLPIRYAALHYCYNNPKIEPLVGLGIMAVDSRIQVRFRQHCGSDSEIAYKLMTFGIPKDILPFSTSGKIKMNYHKQFINQRMLREKNQSNNQGESDRYVVVPGTFDVLLGRQTYARSHLGNVRFHHIVEEHMEQYEQATSKFEKTMIASITLDTIKNGTSYGNDSGTNTQPSLFGGQERQQQEKQEACGGRFLQQRDDGWIVVNDNVARDRVAHAFRNHRARGTTKAAGGGAGAGASNLARRRSRPSTTTAEATSAAFGTIPPAIASASVLSVQHHHTTQGEESTGCFQGFCGSSFNNKRSRLSFDK